MQEGGSRVSASAHEGLFSASACAGARGSCVSASAREGGGSLFSMSTRAGMQEGGSCVSASDYKGGGSLFSVSARAGTREGGSRVSASAREGGGSLFSVCYNDGASTSWMSWSTIPQGVGWKFGQSCRDCVQDIKRKRLCSQSRQ